MKFSDLGKKKRPLGQRPPEAAAPPPAAPPSQEAPPPVKLRFSELPAAAPAAPARIEAKPGLGPQELEVRRQIARKVYGQAIQAMRWFLDNIGTQPISAYGTLNLVIQAVVKLLSNNQALLAMAMHSTRNNYLYTHSVNTAIFSIRTGQGFGWSEEELQLLGLAALLQDVGMIRYMDLAAQPRTLTPEEQARVRQHPQESQRLLDNIQDIDPALKQRISDLIDPKNQKSGGKEMSQVLALCDVYEALTHPRSWRKATPPPEMIRNLLKQYRQEFDPSIIKIFVEQFSLFPPGSWVQLSTGELGVVVENRAGMPTRPTLEILSRPDGAPLPQPLILDLIENPILHIAGVLDEEHHEIKDPELLRRRDSDLWWAETV